MIDCEGSAALPALHKLSAAGRLAWCGYSPKERDRHEAYGNARADHEEYRDLMAATVEAVKGRIPVIAGIIVDSTRDAIRRGKLVRDMKVAALQVTPVHYLFKPDDEAMVAHFRAMADETGMPIII